jgi:hypothetical protein
VTTPANPTPAKPATPAPASPAPAKPAPASPAVALTPYVPAAPVDRTPDSILGALHLTIVELNEAIHGEAGAQVKTLNSGPARSPRSSARAWRSSAS